MYKLPNFYLKTSINISQDIKRENFSFYEFIFNF